MTSKYPEAREGPGYLWERDAQCRFTDLYRYEDGQRIFIIGVSDELLCRTPTWKVEKMVEEAMERSVG